MNISSKEIYSLIEKFLFNNGFSRVGRFNTYIYKLNDDIYGLLGIAIIKQRGLDELKINPNIGVSYPKLTRLVDELTEIKSENEYVNIIAPKNIGYMSHYKTFMGYQVSNSKELKKVTKVIINDILEYGIPHMKKFLNRDLLVEEMKINVPEYAATKLPVFYLLEGKEELINETIEHYYNLRGHFEWFKESYSLFEVNLQNFMSANKNNKY